jgi:anti-sigma factor RsiW
LAPQPRTITLLAEEAVANHVVYTADKRRPTELGAEQRDDLARWVSNRIQHQVAPPDLALAGYRYMGGRLAATDSGPAGMFMYQNDAGLRLTVFVRPVADKTNRPQEIVGVGAMEGCAWIDRGIGYTVVAALPSAELKRVATEIAGRTPAG